MSADWEIKLAEQEARFAELQREAEEEARKLEEMTLRYKNGCKYVGETLPRKGKQPAVQHGWGEFYWPKNVLCYDGYWREGQKHGKGIYHWKDNSGSWEGTFEKDNMHGRGMWRSENRRERRECYYVHGKRVAWADELVNGVRIAVREKFGFDKYVNGTITDVRKDPHRHYVVWDLSEEKYKSRWVDLSIETWHVLGKDPRMELIVKKEAPEEIYQHIRR